jgi:hypothetical protein
MRFMTFLCIWRFPLIWRKRVMVTFLIYWQFDDIHTYLLKVVIHRFLINPPVYTENVFGHFFDICQIDNTPYFKKVVITRFRRFRESVKKTSDMPFFKKTSYSCFHEKRVFVRSTKTCFRTPPPEGGSGPPPPEDNFRGSRFRQIFDPFFLRSKKRPERVSGPLRGGGLKKKTSFRDQNSSIFVRILNIKR